MTNKEQIFRQTALHAAWLNEQAKGAREKRIKYAEVLKSKRCSITDALLKRYMLVEISYTNQYNLIMGEIEQLR